MISERTKGILLIIASIFIFIIGAEITSINQWIFKENFSKDSALMAKYFIFFIAAVVMTFGQKKRLGEKKESRYAGLIQIAIGTILLPFFIFEVYEAWYTSSISWIIFKIIFIILLLIFIGDGIRKELTYKKHM